jgi:hypothetical protein
MKKLTLFQKDRRGFLIGCVAIAATMLSPMTYAQFQPFALRLVRRTGWAELMGRNQCVIDDLYHSEPSFPISDLGTKLSNALELPFRNNIAEISSLPGGDYEGFVRTDGPRGWRIELKGTGSRNNIQLHVGNRPDNTIGCILPGTGNSTDTQCNIGGSVEAMKSLRDAYADATNKRPIVLRIEN